MVKNCLSPKWSYYSRVEWADQVIVGNTEPKGQGSFGLNASYKNFSLFASFMYEFGGQEYNSTLVSKVENADIQYSNVDKRVLTDRWQKPEMLLH